MNGKTAILLIYPICALILSFTSFAIFASTNFVGALLTAVGFTMVTVAQIVGMAKAYQLSKSSTEADGAILPNIPLLQYLSHVGIVLATAGFVVLLIEIRG